MWTKTQQSFRTHFYCSLDPWDFVITFPSTFIMTCLILRFKAFLIRRGNCVVFVPQNAQRFFSHCPRRKWSLSKDLLTWSIDPSSNKQQGKYVPDNPKPGFNKICIWTFLLSSHDLRDVLKQNFANVFSVRVPRWFCKDYIQQIYEYEY